VEWDAAGVSPKMSSSKVESDFKKRVCQQTGAAMFTLCCFYFNSRKMKEDLSRDKKEYLLTDLNLGQTAIIIIDRNVLIFRSVGRGQFPQKNVRRPFTRLICA
jgi:hypothetical protein